MEFLIAKGFLQNEKIVLDKLLTESVTFKSEERHSFINRIIFLFILTVHLLE